VTWAAATDRSRVLAPRRLLLLLAGVGALVAGVLITALLTTVSPLAPLVVVGAVGYVALCVASPAWALVVVGLLIPLESYHVPLGAALGTLSPARAALLVVALGYGARALLWPSRVVFPSLQDTAAIALLLSLLPGLMLGTSFVTVAKVGVNWTAYFIASLAVRALSGRELRRVLLGLGIGGGILGAEGVLSYISAGGAHVSNGGAAVYGRAAAGLADSNYYGGLLLLLLVPLLGIAVRERQRWRLVAALAVLLAVLGVVLSLSRGATLALIVAVGIVLAAWSSSRRASAAILVALVALTAFNAGPILRSRQVQVVGERLSSVSTASSNNTRPLLWKNSIQIMERHPEGVGALGFVTEAERRGLTERGLPLEHAHNSYLNIGVELGLFGLLAFLALLGQVLVQLWREFRLADPRTQALAAGLGAALTGYALQSLTVSLYAVQLIQAVFFILVGASLALPRLRQPPSAAAQRP
jgi:O-antigen ligase